MDDAPHENAFNENRIKPIVILKGYSTSFLHNRF